MLIIITKNYQYIGVLMLISFIVCIITPVTAKSLPHNKSQNNRRRNAKLQAPESHTNEQLPHQTTGDLRQLLSKPVTSLFANVQQTTPRPHLNNIEYDLRLRQLMEELVSNSRIESQHYAVHTLLPLELKDTYQQQLEAIGATATAATVSTADKLNYTHNNKITTSNDGENYQQQQNLHHKDNKDFVFVTPANELLLLDRRNTTLTEHTNDTTTFQTISPPSSAASASTSISSSSVLNSFAGPSLSAASLKDSLLDYVLLEYMTNSKQNLTKIFDINRVEGNSSVALPNSQRIRQQLEFLQKNAEKFKKFQQVEERTKNAPTVTEWDVLKDIDAIQQSALKQQHWEAVHKVDDKDLRVEVWKEILNVEKENRMKSENGTNCCSNGSTQPNVTNVNSLEEFSPHRKQNDTDVKMSANSNSFRKSSATKNDANTKSHTHILENLPIFKNKFQLTESYNNSALGNDLSLANKSPLHLEPISNNIDNNTSTIIPITETHLMLKNSMTDSFVPALGERKDKDFPQNFETTTISEFPEIIANVETTTMNINESEDNHRQESTLTHTRLLIISKPVATQTLELAEIIATTTIEPQQPSEITTNAAGNQDETTKESTYNSQIGTTSKVPDISKVSTTNTTVDNQLQATRLIQEINIDPTQLPNVLNLTKADKVPIAVIDNPLQILESSTLTMLDGKEEESNAITPDIFDLLVNADKSYDRQSSSNESQISIEVATPVTNSMGAEVEASKYLPSSEMFNLTNTKTLSSHINNTEVDLTTELPSTITNNPDLIETLFTSIEDEIITKLPDFNKQTLTNTWNSDVPSFTEDSNEHQVNLPDTTTALLPNSGLETTSESSTIQCNVTDKKMPEFPTANTKPFPKVIGTIQMQPTITDTTLASEEITTATSQNEATSVPLLNEASELMTVLPNTETSLSHKETTVSTIDYEDAILPSSDKEDKLAAKYPVTKMKPDFIQFSNYKSTKNISTATELPITTTYLTRDESTDSFYSLKLTTEEIQLSTQTPVEQLINNIDITTELPIGDFYPRTDESRDTIRTTTEVLPLLPQIRAEERNNNIEKTTELPFTGSYFTEGVTTNAPKLTKEVMPTSTQILAQKLNTALTEELPTAKIQFAEKDTTDASVLHPTEESIYKIQIISELSNANTYFTREQSTDTPKITTEVLSGSIEMKTEGFPTTNTKFLGEDTTYAPITSNTAKPTVTQFPTEESSPIITGLPNEYTYFTMQQPTHTPKTTTAFMPVATQIQTEDSATELPTTNTKATYSPITTTEAKPVVAQFPTKQSLEKMKITTELPVIVFDFTREEPAHKSNELMAASAQISAEEAPNDSVMTTELPTTNTNVKGDEATNTSTAPAMPHASTSQIPGEATNIESSISKESSATEAYIKPLAFIGISKPTVSSTDIPNRPLFVLPSNEKEITTQSPTTKTNPVAVKITLPTRGREKETTNITGATKNTLSQIQTKLKPVLPTTKMPFTTEEITPVSEAPDVMVSNRTDMLSDRVITTKVELPTELPISPTLLPHLNATPSGITISKAELLVVNHTMANSDYHSALQLALPISQVHNSHKVGTSKPAESTTIEEYNVDDSKDDEEYYSLLNDKGNYTALNDTALIAGTESVANLNQTIMPMIDKLTKVTGQQTTKESNQSLKKLGGDVVLQLLLNNKSSLSGNLDRNVVAEVQPESLKDKQLADSINAIKSEVYRKETLIPDRPLMPEFSTGNIKSKQSAVSTNAMNPKASKIPDRLLTPALPIQNLKTEQSVVSVNANNSETSESDNLNPDRPLLPEFSNENFQSQQSAVSKNAINSEASKIPNRLLTPELPTKNLKTEQSADSTNAVNSEIFQDDYLFSDRILVPEFTTGNISSHQSTVSTTAINSETSQWDNVTPDRLLIPELPTEILKTEQSAVSTNTTMKSALEKPDNFEIFHIFQSKIGTLKENVEDTENVTSLKHKMSDTVISSNVSELSKQELNLPGVEVFLQGVTSQEVNSIKDAVRYSHPKMDAVSKPINYTENIRTIDKLNVKETFIKTENTESTTDVSLKNDEQSALKSQDNESMGSFPLKTETHKDILATNNVLQTKSNEIGIQEDTLTAVKSEKDLASSQQDELDVDDSYQIKPSTEILWLLQQSYGVPSITHDQLSVPYETSLIQPPSTFAEQLQNAAKLEIARPQEAPESRLDELITIIGNSLHATSGSSTKSQHVASGVTRQCLDNNNKQQQQEEQEQEQQHQGPKVHADGTAALVNCSPATEQTMQLTTLPSTPSTALTAAATTLALRTVSQSELENVQMMAITKTIENQKDNKGKWTTFKNNHLNNDSLTKADDNEDAQIPEIKTENANNHRPEEDEHENENEDDTAYDEGVYEVDAANKSSINDKDIRLETEVRPDTVMATEISSNNSPVEAEQHNDGHVLDRTNNALYTNNAFKISTATKPMTTIEDMSVDVEGGPNEMSTIESKLFDISKDNRNDMTITGLNEVGHNTKPTLYKVVDDDVTTIGPKKDYTQKGNEHEMTQGNNKDAVIETDDYENGDHQYIITFPTSSSSDDTEQDEVILANIEALDAVAQEVEQLSTLTDTFINTQSFPDVTPYHSNLYYKSHRSRKKKQKLKDILASVNPHPKEEITTTNWWHSLPYTEIRKFLNSISDSVESW